MGAHGAAASYVDALVAAIDPSVAAVLLETVQGEGGVVPASDDYLRAISAAAHEVGALFVLDCVASGAMWVDMQATGVDVLISAPQNCEPDARQGWR